MIDENFTGREYDIVRLICVRSPCVLCFTQRRKEDAKPQRETVFAPLRLLCVKPTSRIFDF